MRRMPELDALRGIAAVVIMLYHLRFMNRFPVLGSAVDLFFVLSGYLITTIILNYSSSSNFFHAFYARRTLRIWPAYFLALGLCLAINPLLPHPEPLDGLPYFLTYTQFTPRYWGAEPPAFSRLFLHSWTLAIEEQFYLLWPILAFRRGRRTVVLLALPFVIVPLILRARGLFPNLLLTRCDGLALGAILAGVLHGSERAPERIRSLRWVFAAIGLAALSEPFWRGLVLAPLQARWPGLTWHLVLYSVETSRVTLFHFALVGFVVCMAGHPLLALLRRRRLVALGTISYGIYLYHLLVFAAVTLVHVHLGIKGSIWIDMGKIAASIGVAALSWKYVERPILAYKDRFLYRIVEPESGDVVRIDRPITTGTPHPARRTVRDRAGTD